MTVRRAPLPTVVVVVVVPVVAIIAFVVVSVVSVVVLVAAAAVTPIQRDMAFAAHSGVRPGATVVCLLGGVAAQPDVDATTTAAITSRPCRQQARWLPSTAHARPRWLQPILA